MFDNRRTLYTKLDPLSHIDGENISLLVQFAPCFRDRVKKAIFLLARFTEIKIGKEKYSREMLLLSQVDV